MRTKKDLAQYLKRVLPNCRLTVDDISREVIIHTGVFETTPNGLLADMEEDDSDFEEEPPEFGRYKGD